MPRNSPIVLRCNVQEKEQYEKDAKALMFNSTSEYIRWLHNSFGHLLSDIVRNTKAIEGSEDFRMLWRKLVFEKDKLKEITHGNVH